MNRVTYLSFSGNPLSPVELWKAARIASNPNASIQIGIEKSVFEQIAKAAECVERITQKTRPVYGINTGVGHFANVIVAKERLSDLQTNLIRSHCVGVGEPLSRDIVLTMWLIRLNTICRGHSGTQTSTVETIIRHLEAGVLAEVPSRGSVGASGDLTPSAHATLALLGEGWCTMPESYDVNGRNSATFVRLRAADAIKGLGIEPVKLGPKEGLSLINGTQLTTALLLKAWYGGLLLLKTANLAAALSIEAYHGSHQSLDDRAISLHGHQGTKACGAEIRSWLVGGSEIQDSYLADKWAQDPYSLRCAPQVHGAVWAELGECERVLSVEINGVADNPLLFSDDETTLSCGNFHAIYCARAGDRLASALTTLASISERRINLAMNHRRTGLPSFLVNDGGLQSGLMMSQVTAAALVSECKSLSFPASVDSIPTNNDQEDHVSMGPTAGFKALAILEKTRHVIAIELLAAAQAIDLRSPLRPTRRLSNVHKLIRDEVESLTNDRILSDDIQLIARRIEEGAYLEPWQPAQSNQLFERHVEESAFVGPGLPKQRIE